MQLVHGRVDDAIQRLKRHVRRLAPLERGVCYAESWERKGQNGVGCVIHVVANSGIVDFSAKDVEVLREIDYGVIGRPVSGWPPDGVIRIRVQVAAATKAVAALDDPGRTNGHVISGLGSA